MDIKHSLRKIAELGMGFAVIATLVLSACGGGLPQDTAAPVTTVAPAVSGTGSTSTTLSVTINEDGTGYYLVQAAASAVPSASSVQAGTSFAMTANVAATPAISGLTAGTSYVIYFIAKDTANNVQTAVQSVALTTPSYVVQGGLTWMPVSATPYDYTQTTLICALTINGLSGWRMPTSLELVALFNSQAMIGQGWTLANTWSSDPQNPGFHYYVSLVDGSSGPYNDTLTLNSTCVR